MGAFDAETKFYNFKSLKNTLQRVYKLKLVEKVAEQERRASQQWSTIVGNFYVINIPCNASKAN